MGGIARFLSSPVQNHNRVRRWWYGHEPELTSRTATFMVLCYLIFFPMDMFFLSRSLAANSPNPPLYAALISSVVDELIERRQARRAA